MKRNEKKCQRTTNNNIIKFIHDETRKTTHTSQDYTYKQLSSVSKEILTYFTSGATFPKFICGTLFKQQIS